MIDRPKRDRLAQALRQLLSGRIDNLAFDDLDCPGNITDSDDRALFEIFYSVWPHYDDFRSDPVQLPAGQKLDFERCVMFLHSDYEFEWPRKRLATGISDYFRRVLDEMTFRRFQLWSPHAAGEVSVWPFYRREDYECASRSPRLLRGRAESGCKQGRDRPSAGSGTSLARPA